MAKDVGDMLRDTLNQAVRDAAQSFGDVTQNLGDGNKRERGSNGALSGMKGVAAGAALAALAPLATKGAGRAIKRRIVAGGAKRVAKKPGKAVTDAASKLSDSAPTGAGEKIKEKVGGSSAEKVKEKVGGSGRVGEKAKEAGKRVLPIGGGDDGGGDEARGDGNGGNGGGGNGGDAEGVGKGRRMPVQQSCDVAVPLETAYNQFTQFEEWPNFMHRVKRVTQEDPCTVSFATKIWAVTREFQADIETQRPDERIKWRVSQGITHTGVVTFHELAPRLTRIELTFDVDPGSLIEKFARGARHVKRAARADLHRFKAFIEIQEQETGAWRGRIEDGELVEEHPEDYEPGRDYSDIEDVQAGEQEEQTEEEEERRPAQRSRRRAEADGGDGSGGSKARSGGGRRKKPAAAS
jgi:uncharacterized membrane protein